MLSPQQVMVVRLAAEGLTDREIADEMLISRWTVRDYWKMIFQKLESVDRASSVANAIRRGEIL